MTRLGERIGEVYEEPLRVAPTFTTTAPPVKQPELVPILLPAEKKKEAHYAPWI